MIDEEKAREDITDSFKHIATAEVSESELSDLLCEIQASMEKLREKEIDTISFFANKKLNDAIRIVEVYKNARSS